MPITEQNRIKEVLDDCIEALHAGRLTKWEDNFVREFATDWETGWRTFSVERASKLQEIHDAKAY